MEGQVLSSLLIPVTQSDRPGRLQGASTSQAASSQRPTPALEEAVALGRRGAAPGPTLGEAAGRREGRVLVSSEHQALPGHTLSTTHQQASAACRLPAAPGAGWRLGHRLARGGALGDGRGHLSATSRPGKKGGSARLALARGPGSCLGRASCLHLGVWHSSGRPLPRHRTRSPCSRSEAIQGRAPSLSPPRAPEAPRAGARVPGVELRCGPGPTSWRGPAGSCPQVHSLKP